MVDKVKPLKFETATDGTQTDFLPTETRPLEDYLSAKGIAFENTETVQIRKDGNNMKFKDIDLNAEYTLRQLLESSGFGTSRYVEQCGLASTAGVGKWLEYTGGVGSDLTPLLFPLNCKIKEITCARLNASACTVGIFKDVLVSPTLIYSFVLGTSKLTYVTGLNIYLLEGENIGFKTTAGSADKPHVEIFIQND